MFHQLTEISLPSPLPLAPLLQWLPSIPECLWLFLSCVRVIMAITERAPFSTLRVSEGFGHLPNNLIFQGLFLGFYLSFMT